MDEKHWKTLFILPNSRVNSSAFFFFPYHSFLIFIRKSCLSNGRQKQSAVSNHSSPLR